jgi:hypothetical protein
VRWSATISTKSWRREEDAPQEETKLEKVFNVPQQDKHYFFGEAVKSSLEEYILPSLVNIVRDHFPSSQKNSSSPEQPQLLS